MLGMMARNWWAYAERGVIAVLFGIVALVWPELTVTSLVIVFGIMLIALALRLRGLRDRLPGGPSGTFGVP